MGSFDGMAYSERQLLTMSDEVSELGSGVAGVATGYQVVAYGTRAAVTDDDYGQAFWIPRCETFTATEEILRFLAGKFHSEGENLGQARAVCNGADAASTIRGDI